AAVPPAPQQAAFAVEAEPMPDPSQFGHDEPAYAPEPEPEIAPEPAPARRPLVAERDEPVASAARTEEAHTARSALNSLIQRMTGGHRTPESRPAAPSRSQPPLQAVQTRQQAVTDTNYEDQDER